MNEELVASPLGLSAAFERLSTHSANWSTTRVMDEGLDLIRDSTWSDVVVLYSIEDDTVAEVAARPTRGPSSSGTARVDLGWFPWGLAPVSPRRFLLVSDASMLPDAPDGGTPLADSGIRSCLHLPILERQRLIGALHLYWSEPRVAWDDERGRLLRLLGRFLLGRQLRADGGA